MFSLSDTMKFLIVFALVFATVLAKDLYSRSIEVPVLEKEGRITNGKNAAPGQFYYQVGLFIIQILTDLWCGGSFIGNNWVLTAAHCLKGASKATVYLGATQRLVAEKKYNVSAKDMVIHPRWNGNTLRNDIALINIPTTSETGKIGIVRIPSNNNDKYIGDIVVLSGWGDTSDHSTAFPNILQYGIMKVSPDIVCAGTYELEYNNATQICVATPKLVSACEGDSGGPLVLDGQNLQIGVFSFYGARGCEVGLPTVFTRVSAYLPWIRAHTGIDWVYEQWPKRTIAQ